MRVISGKAKGLKLLAPDGMDTRPTTDRVKESVFNLLIPYIPATSVLDLFAGSGAMGIEAVSRYCDSCVFVENNPSALDIIHKNAEKARMSDEVKIIHSDALSYLSNTFCSFDIIFLDPPYNKGFLAPVFKTIAERNLLSPDGVIVCETELGGEMVSDTNFECIKQAKYGKTIISIFKNA